MNPEKFRKLGQTLEHGDVAARLPAQDLKRARAFYADKLGLTPVEERPGGLRYRCGNGWSSLFQSSGRPSGTHTQMAWEVDNLEAVVAELRRRGVVFEEYDLPGLKTVNGIAEVAGNYPSRGGVGERAAWFRDSEGNVLGIGQAKR
jgi:catechol 2,3-dioxygenase-like lactoylglutathione lyase family enzyme